MKDISKIAAGFITGSILGASLMLLFAPKKGSSTRIMIGNQAREVADTVGKTYKETRRRLGLLHKQNNKVTA